MATVTPYKNLDGEDCVLVTNADGSTASMYKSEYDLQQATTTEGVTP